MAKSNNNKARVGNSKIVNMKYLFLLACLHFINIVNASDSSFTHKVFVFDIKENEDGYLIKGVDYNIMDTIQILSEKKFFIKNKRKFAGSKNFCIDSITIYKEFSLNLIQIDIYNHGIPLETGKYGIGIGKTIIWRYGVNSIDDIPYFLNNVNGLCLEKKSSLKTSKRKQQPRLRFL